MKKIYIASFKMYEGKSDVLAYALCEDGVGLSSHWCSCDSWVSHDMGITSDWKHDVYKEHCPEGYELIFINNPDHDNNWLKAMEINEQLEKEKTLTKTENGCKLEVDVTP